MTLGKNIQNIRKERGWTQQELATRAELSFNAVAKIEQGVSQKPEIQTIIKIADALGVTLDKLVGRDISDIGINTEIMKI